MNGAGTAPWRPGAPERRHLVLVGGGHSHVQVLRHLAMKGSLHPEVPRHLLDITLVVDEPVAIYSGMVPGFVSGRYRADELEIDVIPLARLGGAATIVSRATAVDVAARRLHLEGRPPMAWDLLSIDIGSGIVGAELPGVREHTLPSRPIGELVRRVDGFVDRALEGAGDSPRIVVVGAGAGGIELAFTLHHRVSEAIGSAPRVSVLHGGDGLLRGSPHALVRRVRAAAAERDIALVPDARVVAVEASGDGKSVLLADGERLPADLVVWVTGATPHRGFDPGSLATDQRGFLSTRGTLQVVGANAVFAVGDCATLRDTPTPKAGVYAVRQGPYLIDNLGRALADRPLRTYRPQRDFLTLLNLGDGTALGSKWGLAFGGRWVMELKDRIDRRFMERFQVLRPDGRFTAGFAAMEEMDEAGEMACGGCAAKLEQQSLSHALARLRQEDRIGAVTPHGEGGGDIVLGLDDADDVAAWRTPGGDVVVRSVDAFRAFADDPWLVGAVAARNALSDIQAKGISPRFALSLVGLPLDRSPEQGRELLYQVLAGAGSVLLEDGVELLGGHTMLAPELWVGFSVDGTVPDPESILPAGPPRPGDHLLLTRPLGSGVLLHAHMTGRLPGRDLRVLIRELQRGNGPAGRIAAEEGASACTDITGFGLAGHLLEMLGGVTRARLRLADLPRLQGAVRSLDLGLRSTAHPANAGRRIAFDLDPGLDAASVDLLFDPQTNGGLLIAAEPRRAGEILRRLHEEEHPATGSAALIGEILAPSDGGPPVEVVGG